MKQLFSILFFFMSLSFLTLSCSDDNDSDSNNNGDNSVLLGSWGEDMGGGEFFEFTFYSDNTGVMNVYNLKSATIIQYTIKGRFMNR